MKLPDKKSYRFSDIELYSFFYFQGKPYFKVFDNAAVDLEERNLLAFDSFYMVYKADYEVW